MKPLETRFFDKITVGSGPEDCWHWIGAICPDTKYGKIGLGGRKEGTDYAHRVSYEIHYEFIPDGLEILHRCHNRQCVNPDHLSVGTRADNMQMSSRDGRLKRPYGPWSDERHRRRHAKWCGFIQ